MKRTRNETAQKKNISSDFAFVSIIVYLIDRFSDWLYSSLAEGFFGRIFTAYSLEQTAFENGFIVQYFKGNLKIKPYLKKTKAFLSKNFENSYFLNKFTKFILSFKSMPIRSYGNFCMSFGIYTILVYFARYFIPVLQEADTSALITGIVSCIIAIPLIFSNGSFAAAVKSSSIAHLLFVEALGIREESFSHKESEPNEKSSHMIFFGMICGALTLILDPIVIPIFILIFVVLALVLSAPEIGILLSIFMLPFFSIFKSPTISLALVVLLTFLSFVLKVIRGKRIVKIELVDFFVIIFGLILYFGGAISIGGKQSYESALISCALLLGYILVVNLMRTERWLRRCLLAFVSSATVVAFLGISQYFFGTLNVSWLDRSYFPDIKGRITVIFENSNVLSTYLVMAFFVAMTFFVKTIGKRKLLSFISCVSIVLCIAFTWSRGAWLALIISSVIFFMFYSKKTVRWLIAIGVTLPFIAFVLPDNVVRRFMSVGNLSDSSIMYRIYTWRGTLNAIGDNLFGGVGYGSETFQEYYPRYALAGIESAEHSHSLYLQLLFSFGIIGLIAFIAVMFFYSQKTLENIKNNSNSLCRLEIISAFCAVISVLIMGLFDYVWFNYRIFYMFWILMAITVAYVKICDFEGRRKSIYYDNEIERASIDIA